MAEHTKHKQTAAKGTHPLRVAYLGPAGSFSEEALLGSSLEGIEPLATDTIPDAIKMADALEADAAFVPLENSIEGSVNATLDELIFTSDLFITAEVVFNVHLQLLAKEKMALRDIKEVISYPVAAAQCREFLYAKLPQAELRAVSSTSEAARIVSQSQEKAIAAVAPLLSAELYGLQVIQHNIEDYHGNQTRFVLVQKRKIPKRSDSDKTTIVCFQKKDKPGNLHAIVGQFAARSINLARIESRPTKKALGDYCFVIDLEGHVSDEVVSDCLAELYAELGHIKFLGSYPAHNRANRNLAEIKETRHQAIKWLGDLKSCLEEEKKQK
ncbi:MAG: prephenate dehydratase [Firmicutes bacterium]|jgi:prephenate dehydratase|nr:prephenate dehydratase [Bacillota bacterium]